VFERRSHSSFALISFLSGTMRCGETLASAGQVLQDGEGSASELLWDEGLGKDD
jgi:hypothetical protein